VKEAACFRVPLSHDISNGNNRRPLKIGNGHLLNARSEPMVISELNGGSVSFSSGFFHRIGLNADRLIVIRTL
jgi:hypothetical protein